jgi:hypothetical protein
MNKLIVFTLACLLLLPVVALAERDQFGNGEGPLEAVKSAISTTSASLVSSCPSPVGGNDGLTWDGTYLWISDFETNRAYKVDPSTCLSVANIPLPGTYPYGLAWDGSNLWFVDKSGATIYKLNPANGSVITSFASPGSEPSGLAWDGSNLWNNNRVPLNIFKLSTTGTLLKTLPATGTIPSGLAYDGVNLWQSDNDTDMVYKLNPANGDVLGSFSAPGTYPNALAWDGRYLWVVDNGTDLLYKYDVGVPDSPPVLLITMNKSIYVNGDKITATEFRLQNFGPVAAAETKVWLGVPTIAPIGIFNLGADGSFIVPASFNTDFGPLELLTATSALPRGNYEFSSRMIDPVTAKTISEDLNPFVLQ